MPDRRVTRLPSTIIDGAPAELSVNESLELAGEVARFTVGVMRDPAQELTTRLNAALATSKITSAALPTMRLKHEMTSGQAKHVTDMGDVMLALADDPEALEKLESAGLLSDGGDE